MLTENFPEFFSGVTKKPRAVNRLKSKIKEEMMKSKIKRMFTYEGTQSTEPLLALSEQSQNNK